MEYLNTFQAADISFREQRTNLRLEVTNLIAITIKGTGKILDINQEGISFGCLYQHDFPSEMSIDILGANGIFIKDLPVVKCWENTEESIFHPEPFEITVGFEFTHLTNHQSFELAKLMRHVEMAEKYTAVTV